MKKILPALLAGLALYPIAHADVGHSVGFSVHSLRHSDISPLAQLERDDAAQLSPRAGRNLLRQDNEARLSYQQGAWTWSVLARQSALAVAPADTLHLARDLQSRTPPGGDRSYTLALDYRGFSGAGLALQRRLGQAPGERGWQLELEAQALLLKRLRLAELSGSARYEAASQSYAFALQGLRRQENLRYPFQVQGPDQGLGLLANARLAWCGPPWCISASVHDLGRLHWRELAEEQSTLDTQTRSYDADGFLIYQPLISGRNRQQRFSSASRPRWQLQTSYDSPLGELTLRVDHLQGFGWLPQLGWRWPLAAPGPLGLRHWGLRWHGHERRLALALQGSHWQLSLGADRWGGQARSRELALAWLQPF